MKEQFEALRERGWSLRKGNPLPKDIFCSEKILIRKR
jgi:hypothetical protein